MDKFVVIDLETTGHSPVDDKIIEVGIVIIQNDNIVDEYSTLLNPHKEIPPFIANLTGINDEDVINAPSFSEEAEKIVDLFTNSYLIAHNVPFDLGFLNEALVQTGLKPLNNLALDTVELARILYPQAPSYKLSQLAEYFHIKHKDPHRALSDAYVTAELFLMLKKKLSTLPYETINHLLILEKDLHSDLNQLLTKQKESLAFAENPSHIVTYNGLAFQKVTIPNTDRESLTRSYGDYLDDIYGTRGTMQRQLDRYEERPGQRTMSEHVYDAFQAKKHMLIEAGTGTGKSIAYLIPALYEAVKTDDRIVISTYTTQLQSQLLEEEIPLIRRLVPFEFTVALLKGKSHYISLERFHRELTRKQRNNYDIALTKAMILVWLTETTTGDIDEIQLPSSGYYFFQSISAEAEGTIDPHSPWFSWSYYQKAKEKAQQADLIITNHALLCTDMYHNYKFLPTYSKAIIDEAHHLEDTASRYYGLQLDYLSMNYALTQIGTSDDGQWMSSLLSKYDDLKTVIQVEQWDDLLDKTLYDVDDFYRTLFQYVLKQRQKDKSLSDIGRIQYRFTDSRETSKQWELIKEMATRITFFLRDLIHMLSLLTSASLNKYDEDDLNNHIKSLQQFLDSIDLLFLTGAKEQEVKWIEIDAYGAKNSVYLYSEPTDMSAILTDDFFNEKDSIVLTSATLTMRNSFSFIRKRLGLTSDQVVTHTIDSPFSYEEQVQLLIPNDFPHINDGRLDEYMYSTCEAILSLAEITKGRMLVLFTSYDMLRRAYSLLKETLDLDEYMLIAQGISSGSRSRLKKNFQSFEQSILLGTSSFWEGVDIPGDDLSCLVIARLPFQPPNHPVYEAKSEAYKENGKSAFFELSLPNAVIRFKQGFGRLIRSTEDRGIVFVCDARIKTARYGKFFLDSIPNVPTSYDSTHRLIKNAEEWF